jgi:hypothetical protein
MVEQSGFRTLVGSYVGQFGSVRPVANVSFDKKGNFRFVIPPQWEHRTNDVVMEGRLQGDSLRGESTDDNGKTIRWEGRRAPTLVREQTPQWGKSIELFNGRDLTGWKPRYPEKKHGWRVRENALVNFEPGNDFVTEQKFSDFKLHTEFRYPKDSNSGIYLRGRYEVQIEDNYGRAPSSHEISGVYGYLTPRINAAKKPNEWQSMDITLVGRHVTVVLNGQEVIHQQEIPGITGGALDSDEGGPGPVMLQGDHGQVEFRKLTLIPAK